MLSYLKLFRITLLVNSLACISFLQAQTVYSNCPLTDSIYHGLLETGTTGETIRVIHQVADGEKLYLFGQKTDVANQNTFFVSAFSTGSTRPIWGRAWKPALNSLSFGHLMVHNGFVYIVYALDSTKPTIAITKMDTSGLFIWTKGYTVDAGFDTRVFQNDPVLTADGNMFFFA